MRIPAYNHERYIERCLDSVLQDSFHDKELVIINDGSTDRTAALIQSWIDDRQPEFPVVFRSRENKGLTQTLNELVGLCNGEYLVSLASDDYLLDGGIAARSNYLDAHPEKFAVMGDCIVVDEKDALLHQSGLTGMYSADVTKYDTWDGLLDEIINNWSVPGPVLMVRKGIYEKVGGYDVKLDIEDWDFYLRMASGKLLGFINQPVSAYRLHGENISQQQSRVVWSHRQRLKTAMRNLGTVPLRFKAGLLRQVLFYTYLLYLQRKQLS